MTNVSNFEKVKVLQEEKRQLTNFKKQKQTEFYHAIAKISYTALVVGIIVAIVQNVESVGWYHFATLALGLVLTYAAYTLGNNKLK